MRGTIRHRALLACALALALSGALAASGCGGEAPDQFPGESAGDYPVEVIQATFKPVQTVAETYDLVIAARNSGDRAIPALNATVNLPGKGSTLAFAYRDPQQGLAQAQRPIWVLEEGYPKLADTVGRGGAESANLRTFDFGRLEPGDTANMVWRLTAIKPGRVRLAWELSAGLGVDVNAVTGEGRRPEGSFRVLIRNKPRLTRVDERGRVVPLDPSEQALVEQSEASPIRRPAAPSRRRARIGFSLAAATVACLAMVAGSACAGGTPGDRGERAAGSAAADTGRSPHLVRVGRFDAPVEARAAPGYPRLMFVVEQPGRVMVIRRGRRLARPFLDLRRKVSYGGERGLLSIAFPPDYRRSGRFYVYFTDRAGDLRLAEYRRRTAVRARPGSGRAVMTIRHRENTNHNGGQLHFLGHDLYFGTGDGGGGGDPEGHAQDRGSLLGKLIRIDPRRRHGRPYTVPRSNPLVGRPGRNEIFAWGFRNPYRWSFDRRGKGRKTRIAIGDVGQDRFEEIDFLNLSRARGGNFGWNRFEGYSVYTSPISGTIKPSLVTPHSAGNCSVMVGFVVRNRHLPALDGRYLFTDFCRGRILSFKPRLGRIGSPRATSLTVGSPTSIGPGNGGAVYVTSLDGPVYKVKQ